MKQWITTWASTPAPRWAEELPAPFEVPELLADQTVRQVARVSAGGDKVRVVLSNEYGTKPLRIGAASISVAKKKGAVDAALLKPLTWGGRPFIVAPPGAQVISDPVDFKVDPLSELAVSIFLPDRTALTSVHWDGVQTAYVSEPGNFVSSETFKVASTLTKRLFLSGIQVDAKPTSQAVVFFGDSITDGNCSTVDANNRWPDRIAERLQEAGHKEVTVVNQGYSGNRVLSDGMGVNALARLDDHILSQPRLSTVVFMMGINDIGWPGPNAITPDDKEPTADDIIAGYRQIIDRTHAAGAEIIGATLTPFADTFKGQPTEGYYTPEKEKTRQSVNEWIRTSGAFDAVIDFDKVVEDPARSGYIRAEYDCGDHLHPNDTGYNAMAESVDLDILIRPAQ
jgi:lysophospholipase L1-like esterase